MSLAGQSLLIGFALLLPLIYTERLGPVSLYAVLISPPPALSPPPPRTAPSVVKAAPRPFVTSAMVAPANIPEKVAIIQDEPAPAVEVPGTMGVPGGIGMPGSGVSGVIASVIRSIPVVAVPPPTPVKPDQRVTVPRRIQVGGRVQAALLIYDPQPVYPVLARQARLSGLVRLAALIGKDGRIQNLRVLQGHPLLVPAAVDAVKQWIYRPTLLNGEPVEVSTVIDVNFTLQR